MLYSDLSADVIQECAVISVVFKKTEVKTVKICVSWVPRVV